MASERQIAANRRNARKSAGPRSGAGKKRASRNAYRHGLTLNITSTAVFAKQLDKLVREIAGDSQDAMLLERARAIAQAELDLARVRRVKVALIERASAFGELDPPTLTVTQMIRLVNAFDRGRPIVPPWRRCRHKSLTDRLKPSDECCQNCVSWTDTSTALLCGETERFSACSVEQNLTTTCSCAIWQNEANFSQFIQYLTNKTVVTGVEGHRPCLHGKRGFCSAHPRR